MLRKTKRLFPLLGIVVLSFLLLMGSVSANILYERYNAGDDGTTGIEQGEWRAQTFTIGNTGANFPHFITGVKLKIIRFGNPGNFTVGIRASFGNLPTGSDLVNMTMDGNTLPAIATWCWFNFSSLYELSASTQYAIVCRAPSGNFSLGNYIDWRLDATASSYAGGRMCASSDNGSTWAGFAFDMAFEEYGYCLPEAQLVSPANNSVLTTKTASLSVKVWDNDTTLPINVSFYIYQGLYTPVTWVNLTASYTGTTKSIFSGTTAYFNFTPCPGLLYAWFIKLTSDGDTKYYPQSGYNWSGDLGVPDPNCDFVWLFTAKTNSYPTVTINYPLNGATYTSYQWQNNHNLSFSVSDAEGDHITLNWMSISSLYGYVTFQSPVTWQNIHNSSFTLDLKPWVTFDNMSYNITFMIDDDAHCYVFNGTFATSLFTIGSANTRTHLSVKDCYPPDGDDNAIGAINTGITFDAITNITQSGAPTIWLFLIDMDKTQQGMLVGGTPYWFNPVTAMGSRYCNYVINPGYGSIWRSFSFGKGFLQVRHTYKVYVGIFSSGDPPGKTTIGVSPASRIEADFIYDLSARPMSFSYEFKNFDVPKKNEIIEDLSNGDAHFVGVTWEFSTYPVGETPATGDIGDTTTGSTWGRTLFAHVDTGLVSWLELIAGLFVVAMFTVMPYILLKKKWSGRNVAMPINITFTAFGLVMAYGMGLLPLWIFIPPVFIIMVILVYKITVWITSRKQLIGGEEGGA